MNRKTNAYFHINPNGLKFKFWCYFTFFAVILLALLWFLQIFFLQNYYEEMKMREVTRISTEVANSYRQLDSEDIASVDLTVRMQDVDLLSKGAKRFATQLNNIAAKNDIYMVVRTEGGVDISINNAQAPRQLVLGFGDQQDIDLVIRQLLRSPTGTISFPTQKGPGNIKTLVYGQLLESADGENAYLCTFSALSPVDSTVEILANQLVYVTVISLFLSMGLSFFISKRLSRPITNITRNAAKLAEGDYGVTFDGGHYSEIVELADTLNYTSRELAKSDNLHKDLIANVSHDLRTPLTMVKSYAEMIRDISGNNPEKRNAHLQVIIDEADRLNQLVSDLLVLSKMQSGVESLKVEEFNLRETVSSILKPYEFLADQEGYHIELQCPGDFFIKGDEARLKQVIVNLVTNAVKHSGGEGRERNIVVTLERGPLSEPYPAPEAPTAALDEGVSPEPAPSVPQPQLAAAEVPAKGFGKRKKQSADRRSAGPETVRLSVRDTGPGIPQEELPHIWERYYKASGNSGRSTSGGSGLGLAIVKEILLLHRAGFGVNSRLGEGSVFWFELELSKPFQPTETE